MPIAWQFKRKRRRKNAALKGVVLLGLCVVFQIALCATPPQSNKLVLNARKVTLPFYHGPENKLSLVAKAERFTRENQRKGFFRIGVLPMIVAHDVNLEVRVPENFSGVVQQFHQYLAGKDLKNGVELRNFTLSVPGTGTSLTASKVRLVKPSEWEMSGSVRLVTSTNTNIYTKAMLVTTGADVGTLRSSDGKAINILAP